MRHIRAAIAGARLKAAPIARELRTGSRVSSRNGDCDLLCLLAVRAVEPH
jgi:hypothetical protein